MNPWWWWPATTGLAVVATSGWVCGVFLTLTFIGFGAVAIAHRRNQANASQ